MKRDRYMKFDTFLKLGMENLSSASMEILSADLSVQRLRTVSRRHNKKRC